MIIRLAVFVSLAVLVTTGALAADDCAQVRAATLAGVSRPYAASIKVDSGNDLPLTSHVVMTGDRMYVEMRRVWNSTPMTTKELIDKVNKTTLKDQLVCQRGGEERLDGVSTTLFIVDDQTPAHASHSRIWIAANGLPLKTEVHLRGVGVVTSLFDYEHVQPPGGAH